jgi:predicted DNA-binding transcriptional regulator AlpA
MLQADLTAPEIKSNEPPRELLTMRETLQLTRYSRPSIYRLIKDKKFPPPLKLTEGGKILFVESEIRSWLRSRGRAG